MQVAWLTELDLRTPSLRLRLRLDHKAEVVCGGWLCLMLLAGLALLLIGGLACLALRLSCAAATSPLTLSLFFLFFCLFPLFFDFRLWHSRFGMKQ